MRTLAYILFALVLPVLAATGTLLVLSPRRPAPLGDAAGAPIPGSLSERVFVEIGGVRQGMFVQGTDPSNPVLLYLHGGPGLPQFFLAERYPTGIERHFTVAWWEHRGAGLSFSPDMPPEAMTLERMIADAVGVADHLRARFGQERIYLLGHSWGSFLGIQVAAAAPDRFHAYVGMAQVAHQLRSATMAHAAMLDAYRARGDAAMVRRLEAAWASMEAGLSDAYMRLRDAAMHRLGAGTMRDMDSVITGIFAPSWLSPAYTLREKLNIWRGRAFSRRHLWETVLRTDLAEAVPWVEVPVYFWVGRHDLTAHPALSRAFFDRLEAPVKGFYTFENAAHSPLFEEPERALEILLRDVRQRKTALADRK
jgi:pimeloyl-ACP methyl ester carboxylesterase